MTHEIKIETSATRDYPVKEEHEMPSGVTFQVDAKFVESRDDQGWKVLTPTGWLTMTCSCGTSIHGHESEVRPWIEAHARKEGVWE